MCHSTTGHPPAPPVITSEIGEQRPLELTAGDGNRLRAHAALPRTPNGCSIVLLPDVRGLHPFYTTVAGQFARAGFATAAIDYYGRTAGVAVRDDTFDGLAHLRMLAPEHVDADVAAAAAWLRRRHPGPLFTVGFCLGGAHSWRQAAGSLDLAGAVGFYGPPRFFGAAAARLRAPLLMLLAGDDVATPPEEFRAMAAALDAAGKRYELHTYPGAPHSFFDVAFDRWAPACADAWARILDFTARHGARRTT